ncbi:hypothetical protein Bhyg_01936, partial [Pseudolycoriella hygida]
MAIDVFNDSIHDTLPAYNWPARSLVQFRCDQIVASIQEKELTQRATKALKTFFMEDDRFDQELDLNNRERINCLANDICEQWPVLKEVPTLGTSDIGAMYSPRLRQMFLKSTGEFRLLLGSLLVSTSTPHNMGTERVVL